MIEESSDPSPERVDGSLLGFAQHAFELREDLFDRIEVGRVFGQEDQTRACDANGFPDGGAFVRAEIIHDDDISRRERRRQNLLDISEKAFAIDRPVEDARRGDLIAAQGREESRGFPVAVGSLGDEREAAFYPAVGARHIGLGPGFVDKNETPWIKLRLNFLPARAMARDVGPILLGGIERFF